MHAFMFPANALIGIFYYKLSCTAGLCYPLIRYGSKDDKATIALNGNMNLGNEHRYIVLDSRSGFRHDLARYTRPIACSTDLATEMDVLQELRMGRDVWGRVQQLDCKRLQE